MFESLIELVIHLLSILTVQLRDYKAVEQNICFCFLLILQICVQRSRVFGNFLNQ